MNTCGSCTIFCRVWSDDKGEAASEARVRRRRAGEDVRGEVRQQPAAAGGGREGATPHRPQQRRPELQQEEHLQSAQVIHSETGCSCLAPSGEGIREKTVFELGGWGWGVRMSLWSGAVEHFKWFLV